LLTKRGESKVGLSTYYIKLIHCGIVFTRMMKRVGDLEYPSSEVQAIYKETITKLLLECDAIQMFVMWEYSNRHLKHHDEDVCNCFTFALDGACSDIHQLRSCSKCSRCVTFIDRVKTFLEYIQIYNMFSEIEQQELKTMLLAIPKLHHAVTHYMAHRLRANVQFAGIEKLKNELKSDSSKILLVIDQKQKVLQMKF
jgi:hypothetical protein